MLFSGIACSLMLLMALSMIMLSYKQQIKFLIAPAISLIINATSMVILQFVSPLLGYWNENFYYPICSVKSAAHVISSMISYFSMMSFFVSMICFFVVYRFHIQAAYYSVLIIDRAVLMVMLRNAVCYQGHNLEEWREDFIEAGSVDTIISGVSILVLLLEIVY